MRRNQICLENGEKWASASARPRAKPCYVALNYGRFTMAGYGLVVLVFAVAAATLGYYWLRND